jgi:hypothetical protein
MMLTYSGFLLVHRERSEKRKSWHPSTIRYLMKPLPLGGQSEVGRFPSKAVNDKAF